MRFGLPSFQEVHAALRAAHERGDFKHPYKRRGTVLGILHQMKLSMWEAHIEMCKSAMDYPDVEPDRPATAPVWFPTDGWDDEPF